MRKWLAELEIHSKAMDDMNLRFMEAWSEENSNVVYLKDSRRAAVKAEIASEFKELPDHEKTVQEFRVLDNGSTAHSDKLDQWSRSDIWMGRSQMRPLRA